MLYFSTGVSTGFDSRFKINSKLVLRHILTVNRLNQHLEFLGSLMLFYSYRGEHKVHFN